MGSDRCATGPDLSPSSLLVENGSQHFPLPTTQALFFSLLCLLFLSSTMAGQCLLPVEHSRRQARETRPRSRWADFPSLPPPVCVSFTPPPLQRFSDLTITDFTIHDIRFPTNAEAAGTDGESLPSRPAEMEKPGKGRSRARLVLPPSQLSSWHTSPLLLPTS